MSLSVEKEAAAEQVAVDAVVCLERVFCDAPMEDFIEALEILQEHVHDRLNVAKEEV